MEVITISTNKPKTALDLELKKCYPFSLVHYVLGAALFLSGIIVFFKLWPEPFFATKFICKPIDYVPSLSAFTGGFFSCILFSTVGRVLSLLQIRNTTLRHIATELDRQGLEMDRERERRMYNIEQTKSYVAKDIRP